VVFSAAGAVYRAGARREDYRHRRVQTFDERTAEIKRIWTDKTLRQQGLPARGAGAERRAVLAGYSQIYLTTGFRQPEAVRLYLSQGYQAQFDLNRDPEEYSQPPFDGRLRFTKTLVREAFSKTA
jgi:hypothetical protein